MHRSTPAAAEQPTAPSARLRPRRIALLLAAAVIASTATVLLGPAGPPAQATTPSGEPVIAAAGDIACAPGRSANATHCQQASTAAALATVSPDFVLALGDSQYESGSPAEYAGSYNPTWGTKKAITRPAAGNHEYHTAGAAGYYGYFGSAAGDPSKGYYSYDINDAANTYHWHVVVLNSECADVGGCNAGSPQELWLKNDLAASTTAPCTLAYWHRPRFSSSTTTPSSTTYVAFWNDLYAAGADVILNGHAHDYERFAPQTSSGAADLNGLREFVIGTGGDDFQSIGTGIANSEARNNTSFGVLKMTLHANTYDWQFVPANGGTFADTGSGTCHNTRRYDATAPTVPNGLTAQAVTTSKINLAWSAATDNVGVTGYNVYRGLGTGAVSLLTTLTTNATAYSDQSAEAGTTYTYKVQAIDAVGNLSGLSAPATATTPTSNDVTPPTVPGGLTGEAVSSTEVDLSWTSSTDDIGVVGYEVLRGASGTTPSELIATTSGTGVSYQDLSVSPSTGYAYAVKAVDAAGNVSGASGIFTTTTPQGPVVHTFTFTSTADATIDQTNPTTNFGADNKVAVDNSPANDFMLRFDIATTGCTRLTSAILQLTDDANGSNKGGDVYTSTGGWTEAGVTWSNAPARGVLLNSLGPVVSNGIYTMDVTAGVGSLNGPLYLRAGSTSNDGAYYYAKESTTKARRPTLTVSCTA